MRQRTFCQLNFLEHKPRYNKMLKNKVNARKQKQKNRKEIK